MMLSTIPESPPYSDQLRQIREEIGLSQRELADALGFGRSGEHVVRHWEHDGPPPNPTSWKAIRYLAMLVTIYRAMDQEQPATALLGSMLPEAVR